MVVFDSGDSGYLTKPVPKVTARAVSAYVPLGDAVCQKTTLNDSAWECTVEASSPMPVVVSRTMWGEMRGILLNRPNLGGRLASRLLYHGTSSQSLLYLDLTPSTAQSTLILRCHFIFFKIPWILSSLICGVVQIGTSIRRIETKLPNLAKRSPVAIFVFFSSTYIKQNRILLSSHNFLHQHLFPFQGSISII